MKKITNSLLIIFLLLVNSNAYASGSLIDSSKLIFKFDFSSKLYYHTSVDNNSLKLPENAISRRSRETGLRERWDLSGNNITDNPLFHGAGFPDFKVSASQFGFSGCGSLTGEHRGQSYGVFNTDNIIVFPKYRIGFDTSFSIFDIPVGLGVSVGNYDNLRLYEGLTMYNIDVQGSHWYVKVWKLKAEYNKIADLFMSIGLNINDGNDYIFSLEKLELIKDLALDIKVGFYNYDTFFYNYYDTPNDNGTTFSAALSYMDYLRIYAQFAKRNEQEYSPFYNLENTNNYAYLIGLSGKYSDVRFKISGLAEYRNYGNYFNSGYNLENVYYRDTSKGTYANSVGANLYPLYYLDRPFGQWAVFSEFQGTDISGYVFNIDTRVRLIDKLHAYINLDYNTFTIDKGSLNYFFYNYGLGYEPAEDCFIKLTITNKTMNLDKHFPTFYMYEIPVFMLSAGIKFGKDLSR
ncbi:MAG: hypothetical protein HW421_1065 [Ignavibacteria bacterium]|nr:hypothetical protein [Ignavibacteria bacterium]